MFFNLPTLLTWARIVSIPLIVGLFYLQLDAYTQNLWATVLFIVVALMAFQAAMWSHAKTEARVVARDTAALIARSGIPAADATVSARTILEADTDLRNVAVVATTADGVVTVAVTADAPGIIRGTSTGLAVRSAVPVEELTP